jgi:glucose-1-phosphate thymidylyltransferase
LNLMIAKGSKIRTQPVDVWEDCGKPETVLHTNRYLLEHGHDNNAEHHGDGYLVVPPVHIAATALIHNSVIGPYATISDGCHITGSIIRDSIIDEDANIEDTTLDQSLIGKGAFVKGSYRKLNVGDSSSVDVT